jgi:SAM-dependent methyltransferase
MKNFEVISFRFADSADNFDAKYIQAGAWSRPYEYFFVIDFIKWDMMTQHKNKVEIHNSSWGFEGIHVTFRDELDTLGKCVHSDIVSSKFRETHYYDITTESKEFEEKFDYVLNVSTIEHLPTVNDRLNAIENLFKQIKPNGHLIMTFDFPRVNLTEIETLVKSECHNLHHVLNGENSVNPNLTYKNLNIVYLIIKKNGW